MRFYLRVAVASVLTVVLLLQWPTVDERSTNRRAAAPQQEQITHEVHIDSSPSIEMYIPTVGLRAYFEDSPCRVKNDAIDPATLDYACTYTADDRPYQLPGTDASDVVVVAGHTGGGVDAVFNELYDGSSDTHRVSLGDVLYIRTHASGDRWLMYRATDLHDPPKDGLRQSTEIWGTDATPGRLLTISCVQPANPLAAAVRNAVVGWQYDGTTTEAHPLHPK